MGGVLKMDDFKRRRLVKSARRAVKLKMLVRSGLDYVVNQEVSHV